MPTITRRVAAVEGTDKASATARIYRIKGFYVLSAGDTLDFPDAVFANVSCIGTLIGQNGATSYGAFFGWTKGDADATAVKLIATGAVPGGQPYYNSNSTTVQNANAAPNLNIGDGASANLKVINNSAVAITLCYDLQLFS